MDSLRKKRTRRTPSQESYACQKKDYSLEKCKNRAGIKDGPDALWNPVEVTIVSDDDTSPNDSDSASGLMGQVEMEPGRNSEKRRRSQHPPLDFFVGTGSNPADSHVPLFRQSEISDEVSE